MFGYSESESVSVGLGGEVRHEDTRLYLFGNTASVVGNGDLYLSVGIGGIEHDDDIFGCSLNGISDDVNKDLRYLLLVSQHRDT